jgi:hypothetical protein
MVGFKVDENLNMRLGEETKGRQVEYHRMGRVRVGKKIFGASVSTFELCTDTCRIYGVP